MRILISPYAARLPSGNRNPKNFPYWAELVKMLNANGHHVIQIGVKGEARIDGVAEFLQDIPLKDLVNVINGIDVWCSVDSFLPHFCATNHLKSGVVIWSQASPKIWGYPHNTNLLKDEKFLREFQYAPWWDAEYNEDAFVEPQVVMDALHGRLFNNAPAKS